jgi:hypothetical protein
MPKTMCEASPAANRRVASPAGTHLETRLQSENLPTLERNDIKFWNLDERRVHVGITLHNRSERPTDPTQISLATAPLGAFVPWRPLATLGVPSLAPGESREFSTIADYVRPRPLGRPDQVPPDALQTALATGQPGDRRRSSQAKAIMARLLMARFIHAPPRNSALLSADPLHALGQGGVYWAGNLNVFIGLQSVERHRAHALRVHRGRENRALFLVGEGYDAYAFRIEGDATDWEPELMNLSGCAHLAVERGGAGPICEGEWYVTHSQLVVSLIMWPPQDCEAGTIAVHVTQHSTGKTAQVEFDLNPWAQGAGCYTI